MPNYTVTENALIKRLNRKLDAYDQKVGKRRGAAANWSGDPYYIWNWRMNLVVWDKLTLQDLENRAREEGCLAEGETLADEEVPA
jgi:hypothetical protein